MNKYYTQYWTNATWRREANRDDLMNHTAGNQFSKKRVVPGDTVYIITVHGGQLYLGGKIVVDKILTQEQAARYLGMKEHELWKAREHLVSASKRPRKFNPSNKIDFSIARNLREVTKDGSRGMKLVAGDKQLDPQTLRGVCELTKASAQELDKHL